VNDEPRKTTEEKTEAGSASASESGAASEQPNEETPTSGASTETSNGGSSTGPKRRRRGRRGGRRHRKKPSEGGAAEAEPAEGEAPAAEAKPRPQRTTAARQPKEAPAEGEPAKERPTPRPRAKAAAPRSRAQQKPPAEAAEGGEAPAAATEGAAEPETASGEGTAAAKRRRRGRRGGRGRSKPAGTAPAEKAADGKAPEKPKAKPDEKKPAGSTRLAARAMRQAQRPRRPRRKLTEEEARTLRGGAKTMLVHEHDERTQIAILEEGVLIEHFVARRGAKTSIAGNIYLGKVQNVLPGMEAAFVDFGRGRNGVLYAGEVNYSPEDLEGDASPRIEKVLKPGQPLMVQVTKDPIGNKGARLTTQISLAGRYLVLAPEQQLTGISRRLAENERARLRQFLREMRPDGHGVIVRTAAEGASQDALERDLKQLLKIWTGVQKTAKHAKAPHELYSEPELTMRVVRDIFSGDFDRVIVDARGVYEEIRAYLDETGPDLLEKLELYQGALPIFEEHRVTEQLHKALERKVWLPSGGSLVIDRTEALTVIDVNTGKFTGKGTTLEDTVFKNNLEAADEVARQLRLRDIGGIIVIDFIDMIDPAHQKELLRTLKRALSRDKTRSQVFEVSNLGLVEMTRKKVSEGLLDAFSEPCPNCEGRGIVLTHEID